MYWEQFLRKDLRTRDGTTLQTHKWVEYLVRDGLLPLLKHNQYDLTCRPEDLANCILNNLIRHERDYKRARFTTYRCKHREEGTMEEYEFFEDTLPEKVWKSMKQQFYIEQFADEYSFAERIWMNLPFIIFDHVSLDSPRFNALYEKLRHLDEEDDNSSDESVGPGLGTERE